MNAPDPVRVVGVTLGDIHHAPAARVKYGYLFAAVAQRLSLVDVLDAKLSGVNRLLNGVISFHPQRQRWQQRFYKNVPAFRLRSQAASGRLYRLRHQADVVLQVGVMFDACWPNAWLPNVIYTDYTSHLSARKPAAGRSPLSPEQQKQWFELERRAYLRAAHICTRSQLVRRSLIEDYGIAPQRVTAVGGGVNFDYLPTIKPRKEKRPPTALFIGNEFYRKGGDLVLEAFAQTRQRIPDARLLLVTRDSIPWRLPREGVHVISTTWNRKKIADLYGKVDVFILPSRLETWGDVLLEAMAAGLPCLGVNDDAMDEIIEHEQTGLLVPPENVDALSSALARLLSDTDLCRQYGTAARQRVEQMFTWDLVAEKLAKVLKSAAGSKVAAAPVVEAAEGEVVLDA
jgi:glycosyltransferase involved in cell wall biosynthesis